MEQGWDPGVKKFFVRILNTISVGMLWMMTAATTGLYFKLAYFTTRPVIIPIIFYTCLLVSLFFVIRYFYRVWKDEDGKVH